MEAQGSGGGTTEPGRGSQGTRRQSRDEDTLQELFASGDPAATDESFGAMDEDEFDRAIDSFDRLPEEGASGTPDAGRMLTVWTIGTVGMAILAAGLLGIVAVQSGRAVPAFAAGLLVGLGGMALGFAAIHSAFDGVSLRPGE